MKKIIVGLVLSALYISGAKAEPQYIIKVKVDGIIEAQSGQA